MTDDDEIQEPQKSKDWLELVEHGERYFRDWQARADNIDRIYSDLNRWADSGRDRQFALFWSNIQVMLPAIYARPPIPVVTPKFKDRRPLYRTASEFLERCSVVSFDRSDIDQTMLAVRDDLAIVGRGVAWVRDDDDHGLRYEHVDRRDFTHDPARRWCDVSWVARRGWLTRAEMRERFGQQASIDAEYQTIKSDNERLSYATDHHEKAGVWEIWHKPTESVVWVVPGVESVLEEDEPPIKVEGFFPCPQPAYATVQRRTLIPVPDMVYYKDQMEEINDLTARIHRLGDALVVKGVYNASSDIGEAVETAMATNSDGKLLIPITSMKELGENGEPIYWFPIEAIANTIVACVELRRQLIEDVYQIIGLSDIMRGQTESDETLGSQRIKQQNGAARVRDKQQNLVRMARDLCRIGAELMAEDFPEDTLVEMSQMELPTDADVKRSIKEMEKGFEEELKALADQAKQNPEAMQDPQAVEQFEQQQQQLVQTWSKRIRDEGAKVTINQVMEFLRDEKLRPFVLDIETDSTIYPDEALEKQSRAEFMNAFTNTIAGVMPLMQVGEEAMPLIGAVLKFALAPYRVGRELEGIIDDFTDAGPQIAARMQAAQGEGQDEGLAQAQMALAEAEMAKVQAQSQNYQAQAELKMQEIQLNTAKAQADTQQKQQQFDLSIAEAQGGLEEQRARTEKLMAEVQLINSKIGIDSARLDLDAAKAVADDAAREQDRAVSVRMQQENRMDQERNRDETR